jgi:hypothetical protein
VADDPGQFHHQRMVVYASSDSPEVPATSTAQRAGDQLLHDRTTPAGIVAGQIDYVQYGTLTPTTIQFTSTVLFNAFGSSGDGSTAAAKGTPIATICC